MFKLESNRLKREFKIVNGNFFASQISNKYSDMSFIPDGNGCEFVVRFADGGDFSAKGLQVIGSSEDEGKLKFIFAETQGISVTLEYWIHSDGNTICKQLTLNQSDDREIDFIYLDSVGIINSKTHLGVDRIYDTEYPAAWAALGQPFYIDSLFFGCEFPATDNRIVHGTGRIKYYLGRSVGRNFKCPVTVMGAAKDNTVSEVKKAFFEYLETVKLATPLRFQFGNGFENNGKISAESVSKLFGEFNAEALKYGLPHIDAFTVAEGWNNNKADFWSFNKLFPNGLDEIKAECDKNGSATGLWISPCGGYGKHSKKFAKRVAAAGNGSVNKDSGELCTAAEKYVEKLGEYLVNLTEKYGLGYINLDGFALKPCNDTAHYHSIGGSEDLYFITDMWQKWVGLFERLRASEKGKDVVINMTGCPTLSPWWLRWVNAISMQNSVDFGISENLDNQSKADGAITYRDAKYYDALCVRSAQLPLGSLFNNEPICSGPEFTDEEFEKYVFWNSARGAALNELHISPEKMNESKWRSLKGALEFKQESFDVLKYAAFIGGNPEENNIYGYVGWDESYGIIALRNPTDEKTSLTLTFNKLMGVPEDFEGFKRENVYCKSFPADGRKFSYNDKLELTLHPFEIMIFKFTK